MTPHQAIRSAIDATDHGRWRIDYDDAAMRIMENLAAAGYQVVTNDLVRNAESYLEATRSGESLYGIPLYIEANLKADALAASLAAHRGDDPLAVFKKGGA